MFSQFFGKKIPEKCNEEKTLKYAIIGDAGSSKTALIKHYTTGVLPQKDDVVIGAEFDMKNYADKGRTFNIWLWNLSEELRCTSIRSYYITNSVAVIICVEMERKSVEHLQQILDQHFIKETSNPNQVKAIIGCYKKEESQQLSQDELIKFSQVNGINASLRFVVDIGNKQQINDAFNAIHQAVISTHSALLEPVVAEAKTSTSCRP